jgi:hypothetical protein
MSTITEQMISFGNEALAIRHLELSYIAQMVKGGMTDQQKSEWESILTERREYLARKIDAAFEEMGMTPDATLESIYAERSRRADLSRRLAK